MYLQVDQCVFCMVIATYSSVHLQHGHRMESAIGLHALPWRVNRPETTMPITPWSYLLEAAMVHDKAR